MMRSDGRHFECIPEGYDGPSLVTAIAHELRKIRGGSDVELCCEARQLLAESFRSLEERASTARKRAKDSPVTSCCRA